MGVPGDVSRGLAILTIEGGGLAVAISVLRELRLLGVGLRTQARVGGEKSDGRRGLGNLGLLDGEPVCQLGVARECGDAAEERGCRGDEGEFGEEFHRIGSFVC